MHSVSVVPELVLSYSGLLTLTDLLYHSTLIFLSHAFSFSTLYNIYIYMISHISLSLYNIYIIKCYIYSRYSNL